MNCTSVISVSSETEMISIWHILLSLAAISRNIIWCTSRLGDMVKLRKELFCIDKISIVYGAQQVNCHYAQIYLVESAQS